MHVSKVTNSIQAPNVLSLLKDTDRLCKNFCHFKLKRAELPDREQAELHAKKIMSWTPVAKKKMKPSEASVAKIKMKPSECASWPLQANSASWPLQDNFGGIRVAGTLPPFKYWDGWSKMLFIKDRLVALFPETSDELERCLLRLWKA